MKQVFWVVCLAVVLVTACREKPALPVLNPINEAVIEGIDSVYLVNPGETISIYPKITFTQDSLVTDSDRYQYEWVFIERPPLGEEYYGYGTVSTENELVDFNIFYDIFSETGPFDFTFRVIDTYTDTYTEFPFRVILGNEYYEGWMVRTEKGGDTQVDMLSYHLPA